jgi:LuxR family maltose regulon positive regulatory protein
MTNQAMTLGDLLRRYRRAAGLTQGALAERAGVSWRTISDLERGVHRAPYRETVAQLARALELDAEETVGLQAAARGPRAEQVAADGGPQAGVGPEQTVLLATKLRIPPARASLIARPRLLTRLQGGLRGPLTLLSAPAGCGKTTLLCAWRALPEGHDLPLAWVSLDADDSDPVRFWSYVITALDRLHPGVSQQVLPLLQSPHSPQPPPIQPVLTTLLNTLADWPADVALVLDDYHLITAPAIHDGLIFLLDHLPARLHLVLATRADPPLPLARLRARGQLTELRASDLRFTDEEAAAFLGEVMGLDLAPAEIAALAARTEGWAAGLQLAALSLQGRADSAGFIAAFTGSHRHVLAYLGDEVFAQQPEAVQTFLLHTAILDRLSGPLCAAVTGRADAQAVLEGLDRANLFTVALDDQGHWYRYHHLFADMLRHRLQQTQPDRVPELHERASSWFEHQGFLQEAIGHALSAGAQDRAAGLIAQIAWVIYGQGAVETLRTWLDALPDRVLRAWPRLCAVQAWLLFGTHRMAQAEHYLQAAEAALHGVPPDRSVEGEIAAVRAIVAASRDDPAQVLVQATAALERLDRDTFLLRGLVATGLASTYLYQGDLALAVQILGEAAAGGRAAGNHYLALALTGQQTTVQRAQGALQLAVATCRQALDWSAERGHPSPYLAVVHLGLADLLREWNDLDAARHHLTEATRLASRWGRVDLQMSGALIDARITAARGDLEGALALVQEAKRHVPAHQAAWGLDILEAFEAQLWVAQGHLSAAGRWLQRLMPEAAVPRLRPRISFYIFAYEHCAIAPVQVLLAQGRAAGDPAPLRRALALLERQSEETERAGLAWRHIKALALQALAHQDLGQGEKALGRLEQALRLAEPEGYVRLFVDEGAPMAALLAHLPTARDRRQAAPERAVLAYARRLLAALAPSRPTERAARPAASLLDPLSEREVEVLRLIVAGLSNRAIAARLYLAVSTVKWYVNTIFSKLDVASRAEAIARARALRLVVDEDRTRAP